MKRIKLFEDFDFDENDFDFEEEDENENDFKVGYEVYLPIGKEDIATKTSYKAVNGYMRGEVNGIYHKKIYNHTWGNKKIEEIETRNDGVEVFRLESQWPFHEPTNWKKY